MQISYLVKPLQIRGEPAAVVLYVYASGLMGSLQASQVRQPYLEQIAIDYYNWTTPNTLKLAIRNVGSVDVTMADFFFIARTRNTTALTFGAGCNSPRGLLPVRASCILTFPMPSGFTPASGIAYMVKIVTKDGAVFSYSCIAGQSSLTNVQVSSGSLLRQMINHASNDHASRRVIHPYFDNR